MSEIEKQPELSEAPMTNEAGGGLNQEERMPDGDSDAGTRRRGAGRDGALSILLVDDFEIVRQATRRVLEADGHDVTGVEHGLLAKAIFRPGKFDVVITHSHMPLLGGLDLAREIRKRAPEQPVILMTVAPEELRAEGRRLGDVDFILRKPFTHPELKRALSAVLGEPYAYCPIC